MKPADLLTRHADTWHTANASPISRCSAGWLFGSQCLCYLAAQDYLFVLDELTCQARLLARAPRSGATYSGERASWH